MRTIPLSQGEVALVSEQDYERVSTHKWSLSYSPAHSPKKYAVASISGKQTGLHRFVLGVEGRVLVDHIDGDGLNNTRENLRECTYSQNRANSSTRRTLPKGVYVRRQRTGAIVYRAQIRKNYHITSLGTFATVEEAAMAYASAASVIHKEFAKP